MGSSSTSSNNRWPPDGNNMSHPNLILDSRTNSSKTGKPVVSRSGSDRSKTHPLKKAVSEKAEPGDSPICNESASNAVIVPTPAATTPSNVKVTVSFVLRFSQSLKNRRASSDELMFCSIAERYGSAAAIHLAGKFRWQCQEALRLLLNDAI